MTKAKEPAREAYNPGCYYCRNGYCHSHTKGAGGAEYARATGTPIVEPSSEQVPEQRIVSQPQAAAEKLKLTRDNGSWIPEVLEQVLIASRCGVSGHFAFQDNGGNCLMCQREARIRIEAREAAIHENPDYRTGVDDALKIAIPIAKCSCADRIVGALQKHRAKVATTSPTPSADPNNEPSQATHESTTSTLAPDSDTAR